MEPGTQLGHYEILGQLGAGGMGQVYRARDTTLDRDVAIKVLPEDFAADADRLARFEREAKLLASLNHPNIATIHGFDETAGVRFIAMELVEGQSLDERIAASGRIEVGEAIEIARRIALAFEAAQGRCGSSRSKARQRAGDGRRDGQGARLRARQGRRGRWRRDVGRQEPLAHHHGSNRYRRDHGHRLLQESRAGAGQTHGQAHRRLVLRVCAVRNADRQARLRWRHGQRCLGSDSRKGT